MSGELRGIIDEMQELASTLQGKLTSSNAFSAETYVPLSPAASAAVDKFQKRVMQVIITH